MGSSDLSLRRAAQKFAVADDKRAWLELVVTMSIYAVSMGIAITSVGNWLVVVPAMFVAAAMGLRAYMIQHDCLHRAFFTTKQKNDVVGILLSPVTMTAYRATRYIHLEHHAHVSDLEHRESFEIHTMTVKEWEAASPWQRAVYRAYRSPWVLIVFGPFVLYLILRRAPLYGFKTGVGDLILHNLMLAGLLALIWSVAGWAGIAIWAGTLFISCFFGAWIPYVFHNFEDITCGVKPELDFETAALEGSSVLDLGWFFDLMVFNISYHDLHHFNAKIPGYRLREAHQELERLGLLQSRKIGWIDGIKCMQWKLYDEDLGRMVPFPKGTPRAVVTPAE